MRAPLDLVNYSGVNSHLMGCVSFLNILPARIPGKQLRSGWSRTWFDPTASKIMEAQSPIRAHEDPCKFVHLSYTCFLSLVSCSHSSQLI